MIRSYNLFLAFFILCLNSFGQDVSNNQQVRIADNIFRNKQFEKAHLKAQVYSIIKVMWTDTIFANPKLIPRHLYTKRTIGKISQTIKLDIPNRKDSCYSTIDSTLYTGVFVKQEKINPLQSYTLTSIWNIVDGIAISKKSITYCKVPSPDRVGYTDSTWLCEKSFDWGQIHESYFPNGKLHFYSESITLNERYSSMEIKIEPNGDTLYSSLQIEIEKLENHPSESSFLSLYKNKDTVTFEAWIDEKKTGERVNAFDFQINDSTINYVGVKQIWEEGHLMDILNEDVIYINNRDKVISKMKFLKLYSKIENIEVEYDTIYSEEVDAKGNYRFILYGGTNRKKYFDDELVQKILTKRLKWDKKGAN